MRSVSRSVSRALCLSVSLSLSHTHIYNLSFAHIHASDDLIGYIDEGEQAPDGCCIAALCGLEQLRPTAFLFLRRLRSCVCIYICMCRCACVK